MNDAEVDALAMRAMEYAMSNCLDLLVLLRNVLQEDKQVLRNGNDVWKDVELPELTEGWNTEMYRAINYCEHTGEFEETHFVEEKQIEWIKLQVMIYIHRVQVAITM